MVDFFFRMNKCTYLLLQIPKRLQYWLTAGILCLIITVWLVRIYQPLRSYYAYHTAQIEQYKQACTTKKSLQQKNEKLTHKLTRHTKCLQQTSQLYKKKHKTIHETLRTIFGLAHQNQLTILNHVPLETIDRKWYTAHLFQTNYTGTYAQIISFFNTLHAQQLTQIQKMTLCKNNTNLTLSLFFSITDIKGHS